MVDVTLLQNGTDVGAALQTALDSLKQGDTLHIYPGAGSDTFCTLTTGVYCNTANVRIEGDVEFHLGIQPITAFTLTGFNQKLIGPRIVGQRVLNQKGVVCTGYECRVQYYGELLDYIGHSPSDAKFVASQSGLLLSVTQVTSGTLSVGQLLSEYTDPTDPPPVAPHLPSDLRIVAQVTGTSGGAGSYQVSQSATVSSRKVAAAGAGYHNFWEVYGRNALTAFLWLEGGVGPTAVNCTYDTDGAWYNGIYPEPTKGGIWLQTDAIIDRCDIIHSGCGLIMECAERDIVFPLIGRNYFDSTISGPGIRIVNNTAHKINGVFFNGTWSATGRQGVVIEGSGVIDGVFFSSCAINNNLSDGYYITAGTNIVIDNPQVYGNNAKGPLMGGNYTGSGSADGIVIATPGKVIVRGGAAGGPGMGWIAPNRYNINVQANATDVTIDSVDLSGATISGQRLFEASGATGVKVIDCPAVSNSVWAEDAEMIALGGAQRGSFWLQPPFGRATLSGNNPALDFNNPGNSPGQQVARLYLELSGSLSLQAMDDLSPGVYTYQNSAWTAERVSSGFTRVRFDVRVHQTPLTVAQVQALPSPLAGDTAFVSDAGGSGTVVDFAALLTGGGIVNVPVYYDGADWRCG